MKTIIAIWNSGSKGKSSTLREFANLIISTYPDYKPIYPEKIELIESGDFRLVLEINGVIIGIESQGDPNTDLEKRLFELSRKYDCNLIFCTTRTRGETVYAVENLAKKKDYNKIWTSTYQIDDLDKHNLINQLKGKHLLDLIINLNLI